MSIHLFFRLFILIIYYYHEFIFLFIYLLIIVRDDGDEENAEPTTNLKPEKRRLSSLRSKFIWSSDESNDIFRNLTPLEISMISLYNPITSFQIAGAHFQSKTPVYYIVNDIADVATKLPNNINKYDHAILRYIRSNGNIKNYSYRPSVVLTALRWLIDNNHLYRDIVIDVEVFRARGIDFDSNVPVMFEDVIDVSEDEQTELDKRSMTESRAGL